MRRVLTLIACLAVLTGATFISTASTAAARGDVTITLVTHDSFAISKRVLAAFTKETGIEVKVLPAGDAGAALNQAILTKDDPIGDLLYGVDNTFLSRALSAGIFEKYSSPALSLVPKTYQLDAEHRVTPVDHADVCVNYDKRWFADHKVKVPTTLEDLTKPAYKGLLSVENPATSSPGLAFELATISQFGTGGWRDYWSKLRANDVEVVNGWEEAYNGSFSAGEGNGPKPLVVSYASDPAAAVYYASDPKPTISPVGTLLASCFRQTEFVGVLEGTPHARQARKLVDFMLSRRFQADMPLQMFVLPVRDGTPLPPVFQKFTDVPTRVLTLPAAQIGGQRDRWIEEWTSTVLR